MEAELKRITIEVDDETHQKLADKARADDRPLVKYIRRLLEKAAK